MKLRLWLKLLVFTVSCIKSSTSGGGENVSDLESSLVRAPINFYNYGAVYIRISGKEISSPLPSKPFNPNGQPFNPPYHTPELGITAQRENSVGILTMVGLNPPSFQPPATATSSPAIPTKNSICQGNLAVQCFNSFGEFGVVYFNETNSCHCIGDRGPCGESAVIYQEDVYSLFGKCDCIFTGSSRIQIYNTTTRSCSDIFTQAHCNADEWLTLEPLEYLEPICETNSCVNATRPAFGDTGETVLYNGKCQELFTNCSDITGAYGYLGFEEGYVNPRCQITSGSGQFGGGASYGPPAEYLLRCKAGSYLAVTGQCKSSMTYQRVPRIHFDIQNYGRYQQGAGYDDGDDDDDD